MTFFVDVPESFTASQTSESARGTVDGQAHLHRPMTEAEASEMVQRMRVAVSEGLARSGALETLSQPGHWRAGSSS